MQQDEMEKQRKKDDDDRKRYREMVKRQKRMLEAAFDGNNDEILAILKEVCYSLIIQIFFFDVNFKCLTLLLAKMKYDILLTM